MRGQSKHTVKLKYLVHCNWVAMLVFNLKHCPQIKEIIDYLENDFFFFLINKFDLIKSAISLLDKK